jgi:23S rRNA (pseudouridine1915-N3)-methyltransferase
MKISIIAIGKIKESFWRTAQGEYSKRLGPYIKLAIIEIDGEKLNGSVSDEEAMRREGEKILKYVPTEAIAVALDKSGKQFSSEEFSARIDEWGGTGELLVFIIGGATGLSAAVLARADKKLSLSEMTLPHELARIFLLEQIYRATMIQHRKSYHR